MKWHDRFLQQAAWTRDLRAYLFNRAGLPLARVILEVGCGTGAILSDLDTPAALHGIDIDLSRLIETHQHVPRAVLACADAVNLPYPSSTFDITFCHFLLLWVPNPLSALLEIKRVTRPGGSVLALAEPDYSSRVDQPPALAPLGAWQEEALRRQGADASLGARLGDLFYQAGIPPVETGTLQVHKRRRPDPSEREMEWEVLVADLAGSVPREELMRFKKLDEKAWEEGKRVLHVPTYFAYGVV